MVAKKANFRQLAEFEFNLPWPLSNRGAYIQACGVDLPKENACILTMSSKEGNSWLGETI